MVGCGGLNLARRLKLEKDIARNASFGNSRQMGGWDALGVLGQYMVMHRVQDLTSSGVMLFRFPKLLHKSPAVLRPSLGRMTAIRGIRPCEGFLLTFQVDFCSPHV